MIYLFETDGAGGRGVSDLFRKAYGDDAFASFYCPHPAPPFLEISRIAYLGNYFGAAKGLAANISIDVKELRKVFPEMESAIVLRNPVSASIRSYQAFLTTYAQAYWPDRTSAPSEYVTLGAYIKNIRGSNYLCRALAGLTIDEPVELRHLDNARASLANFDHYIFSEDLRLSMLGLLQRYPAVRALYGSDQYGALQSIDHYLSFDAMHVSPQDIQVGMELNAYDLQLFADAMRLTGTRYLGEGKGHAL